MERLSKVLGSPVQFPGILDLVPTYLRFLVCERQTQSETERERERTRENERERERTRENERERERTRENEREREGGVGRRLSVPHQLGTTTKQKPHTHTYTHTYTHHMVRCA